MVSNLLVVFTLLAAIQDGPPVEKVDVESRAKTIAPFLDEQTVAIVHVDVSRINVDAIGDLLTKFASATNFQAEAVKVTLKEQVANFLKAGGKEAYLVVSAADLPEAPFLVVPIPSGVDPKAIIECLPKSAWDAIEQVGPVVVAGNKSALQRFRQGKPAPRPEVAQAFATAGDMPTQAIFIPTAQMRRIVEEMWPTVPFLKGVPTTVFTHGVQWEAIGIQSRPSWAVRAVIQSRDAESA
jgi:hypothetical protein